MSTEEKMASEETFDENEKMNAGETKTEPAADGAGTEEAPEENTVSEETPEEKAPVPKKLRRKIRYLKRLLKKKRPQRDLRK